MADHVSMALVGCGNIARAHWRGIRYHAPRIRVTAAVDADIDRAEAMAARTGAKAFASLADALADGNFDAVDLMLPHDQHEAAAVECFAAGKHVVLEKTDGPRPAELRTYSQGGGTGPAPSSWWPSKRNTGLMCAKPARSLMAAKSAR